MPISFYLPRYENTDIAWLRSHVTKPNLSLMSEGSPFFLPTYILFISFIIHSSHSSWIQPYACMICYVWLATWFIFVEEFLISTFYHLVNFTILIYIDIFFIKTSIYLYYVCIRVWSTYLYMHHICVWSLEGQKAA